MTQTIQIETNAQPKSHKYSKLVLSLIFDGIGMLSYAIPLVAEIIDLIWAPISGLILAKMYPGTVGKVAGIIEFLEEILPETDIIPTFTLTWFYVYVYKKEK
jgi:hypothetical protein